MEELIRFVTLAQTERFTLTELCEQFSISRKTAYNHLERYAAGGFKALGPRSSRPLHSPARTDEEVIDLLLGDRHCGVVSGRSQGSRGPCLVTRPGGGGSQGAAQGALAGVFGYGSLVEAERTEAELREAALSAPLKLQLAARIRKSSGDSVAWLAEKLVVGKADSVRSHLSRHSISQRKANPQFSA